MGTLKQVKSIIPKDSSKKDRVVVIVSDGEGDWEAMYIDGKLMVQGHSISVDDLARVLGVKLEREEVDSEWIDKRGEFPNYFSEIPMQKLK